MERENVDIEIIRGGTSKGVFIRLADLPDDPCRRDELALALMGSPDPMQLDGLGGTHSSTSKLMAVGTSDEARRAGFSVEGNSVTYLFAQVGVDSPVVDWKGNCGNLTTGVAVYALELGLLPTEDPETTVEMTNLNTGVRVTATVPTTNGMPREDGDFSMPGIPGTGARIDLTFHDPAASLTGRLFPTGRKREDIVIRGTAIAVTILDVTNPVVVVAAADLGIQGIELPSDLNRHTDFLDTVETLRSHAAVRCGLASDAGTAMVDSPAVPRVILVAPPQEHTTVSGQVITEAAADYVVRTSSMGVIHHAFTGTGLMASAVAAAVSGTVFERLGRMARTGVVRLAHPKGVVDVSVDLDGDGDQPTVRSVTVARTARRLLSGRAYLKTTDLSGKDHTNP